MSGSSKKRRSIVHFSISVTARLSFAIICNEKNFILLMGKASTDIGGSSPLDFYIAIMQIENQLDIRHLDIFLSQVTKALIRLLKLKSST